MRHGRQHGAGPGVLVHRKRLAVAATADLQLVVATHEVVVAGVEREQHPHAPVGVGPEHHEIAVLLGARVHLGAVAPGIIVVVEPDLHGRVTRLGGEPESKHQ